MPVYFDLYGDTKPQTVKASSLQAEKYLLVSDSQNVESLLESIGFPTEYREDITAIIAKIGDGDYNELWFSESGRYYDLSADYHNLAYYTAE